MGRLQSIALCLLISVAAAACSDKTSVESPDDANTGTKIGQTAPGFTQNSPSGTPVSLLDYRGKVVLLDFWATWCGPCIVELPHVQSIWKKYRSRDFAIIGVSLDNDLSAWRDYLKQQEMDWVHTGDGRGWSNVVALRYEIEAIPQTYLIDKRGTVIGRNLRGVALDSTIAAALK